MGLPINRLIATVRVVHPVSGRTPWMWVLRQHTKQKRLGRVAPGTGWLPGFFPLGYGRVAGSILQVGEPFPDPCYQLGELLIVKDQDEIRRRNAGLA